MSCLGVGNQVEALALSGFCYRMGYRTAPNQWQLGLGQTALRVAECCWSFRLGERQSDPGGSDHTHTLSVLALPGSLVSIALEFTCAMTYPTAIAGNVLSVLTHECTNLARNGTRCHSLGLPPNCCRPIMPSRNLTQPQPCCAMLNLSL